MTTYIFVILSIILQVVTAFLAIRHFKLTKFNLAWVLISFALVLMAVRRAMEFFPYISSFKLEKYRTTHIWLAIITSILFFFGLLLITKLFKHLKAIESTTRALEERLLNATLEAEEAERQRIAKELHDGIGPLLSAIKMSLSVAQKNETTHKEQLIQNNTKSLVEEAIKSIKEISNKLSPHILENFGLRTAINKFIASYSGSGIKFELSNNLEDLRFSRNIEIVCYRIISELINNTIKHANASSIDIKLLLEKEKLMITYFDNGVGYDFSPTALELNPKGMGLYNIASRVKTLNGTLNFSKDNGNFGNTVVQIEIPI